MPKTSKFFTGVLKNLKAMRASRYFSSSLIIAGFCLASFVLLHLGSVPSLSRIKEGDISLRSIYAPYDFTYPTDIDREKTEEARAELEGRVNPVYDIGFSEQDKAFTEFDVFFAEAGEISRTDGLSVSEKAELLRSKIDFELSDKDLALFVKLTDPGRMRKVAKDALENVFLIGVVSKDDKDRLIAENREKISIRNPRFHIERETEIKGLLDEKEAGKIVRDTIIRLLPSERPMRGALNSLVEWRITTNAKLNAAETSARREEARNLVPPIYKRATVKKSELIVERGKRITKDDIAKLTQITRLHSIVNRASYMSGLLILLVGLVFITAVYLKFFEKAIAQAPKRALLICINAFLAIAIALIVTQSQISGYMIPLAGIGMILVLLLNANTAFIVTLVLSIYIGFMAGGKLNFVFMLFLGSVVGIYAVRGARRRSQIFFAGFAVSLANFFSIVGIGFLNNMQKEAIVSDGLFGVANGIISSFIVIGLLPVFEYAFRLITNITLLELSDLSSPLLKELTIKAPGTYHHSILVGNLAEDACNTIGANSLLARVGSYYHDIGKMEKAAYFVENEIGIASKHDKLTPSMSALIITNHVKDGVELAKKYKLNSAIADFVSHHHGTSLIYYFYQRALEKVKSEEDLKEEEFRYPGPKPQSKETAIVLLADSVEASSRMLSEPTPSRIRGLVEKIMNNKFIDGQLDECDLTLKDLHKISESFVRVLMGVFHTRLEYPEVKSRKERKNASKGKSH